MKPERRYGGEVEEDKRSRERRDKTALVDGRMRWNSKGSDRREVRRWWRKEKRRKKKEGRRIKLHWWMER